MSNRVLISADCVCDIPVELAEKMGVSLMYYYIITEEGRFRDMTEIRMKQVIEYMEVDRKKVHSAAAEKEDYREYFMDLRRKAKAPIVHICMSKKLSRGYERAAEVAEEFRDIFVIDSGMISGSMGYLVFRAAELARAGACKEIILKMVEQTRKKLYATLVLGKTECALRTGLLEKSMHIMCEAMGLHPMLRVENGEMRVFGLGVGDSYRYVRRYLKRSLGKCSEINPEFGLLLYTGCSDELVRYAEEELRRLVSWKRLMVVPTYATVSCDIGSGCLGVVYMKKRGD